MWDYGNTVASEGLIILQDATLVYEALLLGRDVAAASGGIFEGTDGGIDGNLNGKLETVGAANVDVDVDPFGFLNGTVTSHGVSREARHSHALSQILKLIEEGPNPNPRVRKPGSRDSASCRLETRITESEEIIMANNRIKLPNKIYKMLKYIFIIITL